MRGVDVNTVKKCFLKGTVVHFSVYSSESHLINETETHIKQ